MYSLVCDNERSNAHPINASTQFDCNNNAIFFRAGAGSGPDNPTFQAGRSLRKPRIRNTSVATGGHNSNQE